MKILMTVFNDLECDGRVQRAASALAEEHDLRLHGLGSRRPITLPPGITVVHARTMSKLSIVQHLSFMGSLLMEAVSWRPDIVYAHDYFLVGPGRLAAAAARAKFVYDAHELLLPTPGEALSHRRRLFCALETLFIGHADLVIAANAQRAEIMADRYKLEAYPAVVRNVPLRPPDARPLRDGALMKLGVPRDRPILVYQGDVNLNRGLKPFIRAVGAAQGRWRMVIIGGGPDVRRISEWCRDEGWDCIHVIGRRPGAELPDLLRECDVGLVCYPSVGLNNIFCAPNKVFEYAHAHLPIVATDQAPLIELVQNAGIGRCIPPHAGPTEVLHELDAVRSLRADNPAQFIAGVDTFLDSHSWHDEADRLRSAVARIQ